MFLILGPWYPGMDSRAGGPRSDRSPGTMAESAHSRSAARAIRYVMPSR
jgi:hypothetical protein